MKTLIIVLFFGFQIACAETFLFDSKIKICTKNELDNIFLEIEKSISNKMSKLNDSQRESFFYKETIESELIGIFGSRFLPNNTRLSLGAKACGYHMDLYILSLKERKRNSMEFLNWISCMKNDYRNSMPNSAKLIIECTKKY